MLYTVVAIVNIRGGGENFFNGFHFKWTGF